MASSSVSQDDIDNDFEKNSRRSRIRTARARQINPGSSSCRAEMLMDPLVDVGGGEDHHHHHHHHNNEEFKEAEQETSPKPMIRSSKEASSSKRPTKMNHHTNKGKQQRERRKLREKRRSTGVVHLASTESTGGSTTGDDEESSDAGGVNAETKRNTQQNEADNILLPLSSRNRDKSASDLEADDETDTHEGLRAGFGHFPVTENSLSSASTPVIRPTTPTCDEPAVEKVVEENRRLLSMMDEKDKRIHHLEFRIQQLMKDTLTISEEQSRLQKENKTLLRALSNLSTKEKQ